MEKKPDSLMSFVLKIFLLIVLPLIIIFIALNTKITGFSITSGAKIITGSFLGIIAFFFIILFVILKLGKVAYKKEQ
jgi:hypothetical protein